MTQGFDEWMNKKTPYGNVSIRQAYKAGAASRQAEIDELKQRITMLEIDVHIRDKMINDALDMLEGRKGKVLFDDIVDTLKGESNE